MILLQSTSTYIISTVNLLFRIEREQNLFYFFVSIQQKNDMCACVQRPKDFKNRFTKNVYIYRIPMFNKKVFLHSIHSSTMYLTTTA